MSRRADPLTDGLCREGPQRVCRSLERVVANGKDRDAREDMALASLFGGMALANAGLGAVHGFAGPLGGMMAAPHGMICAALLPAVMAANIRALRERQPDDPSLERYRETAALLTGRTGATAREGVDWAQRLVARLEGPSLSSLGFSAEQAGEAVRKARQASSMKGNPVALTEAELTSIYHRSL